MPTTTPTSSATPTTTFCSSTDPFAVPEGPDQARQDRRLPPAARRVPPLAPPSGSHPQRTLVSCCKRAVRDVRLRHENPQKPRPPRGFCLRGLCRRCPRSRQTRRRLRPAMARYRRPAALVGAAWALDGSVAPESQLTCGAMRHESTLIEVLADGRRAWPTGRKERKQGRACLLLPGSRHRAVMEAMGMGPAGPAFLLSAAIEMKRNATCLSGTGLQVHGPILRVGRLLTPRIKGPPAVRRGAGP